MDELFNYFKNNCIIRVGRVMFSNNTQYMLLRESLEELLGIGKSGNRLISQDTQHFEAEFNRVAGVILT